ncbi:glycosyltransferase family 2 protein [Isoptericola cucumis]|uniref:glycosyltransferase family 2 protein n=1 Tax=Isoptericola cucumis TaxID=1776856 RepID=UPI0032088D2D
MTDQTRTHGIAPHVVVPEDGRSHVDGLVWMDGVLHVRATTRWVDEHGAERTFRRAEDGTLQDARDCDASGLRSAASTLTVRERGSRKVRKLPGSSTTELVPVPGSDDLVSVRLHVEGRLDPSGGKKGTRLGRGVWDVRVKTEALGVTHHVPAATDTPTRPAIVGRRQLVAYRNRRGTLSVDAGGNLRTVVDGSRPRTDAATTRTRTDGGRRTSVTVSIPLDGVRVWPVVEGRRGPLQGTAELVAPVGSFPRRALLKVRRRLGASSVPGRAAVTVHDEDVTLTATAAATPGLWQLVVSLGGDRHPAPFLVRIARDGSATLTATPAAGGRPHVAPDAPPKVSVVVPVYNAERFVEEAIRSVFAQSMPAEQIEIVAVDDGSTDDSLSILHRLAGEHPRMRVLTQPNSGSAAAPRNTAIEAATGTYLFFLDADDLLTPRALEKLVEAADVVGADVALGRMKGIGGRGVAKSMFARSTLDAHMVRTNLIRALGPTKMFRREHVLGLDAWFRPGLRNGEDLAFVAEAELTARRIVVRADGDYYIVRGHDGVHMSRIGETLDEKFAKAWSLAEVVERHTGPGPDRDALLVRPFGGAAVEGLFRRRFLELDDEQRAELVERVADRFGHLWTPGLRAQLPAAAQPLLELVFRRRADLVGELVEHAGGNPRDLEHVMTADGFVLDVPPSVAAAVDPALLGVPPTAAETQLTSTRLRDGSAVLRGWVRAVGGFPVPDGALARWTLRDDGRTVDVPARALGARTTGHGPAAGLELVVETAAFPAEGVWDLSVAPTWGDVVGPFARFGGNRTGGVGADDLALGPADVLYGTLGHGNLSLDHGGTTTRAPLVRVVGTRWDADGRPEVLVALPGDDPSARVYAQVEPAGSRGARQLLPSTRVDATTLAARLPVPRSVGGEERIELTVAHDGTLSVPEHSPVPPLVSDEVALTLVDGTWRITRTATTSSEVPA